MSKKTVQPNYRRRTLRLPDLDHSKLAVLNSLGSPGSRRVYEFALNQFIAWYCSEPRLALNRIVVTRYRMYLESRGLAANNPLSRKRLPPGSPCCRKAQLVDPIRLRESYHDCISGHHQKNPVLLMPPRHVRNEAESPVKRQSAQPLPHGELVETLSAS